MTPPSPTPRRVAAAVIRRDGRYLACRRPPDKRHGNPWEFPGGKTEHRETIGHALTRELAEELELRVTAVGRTLHVFPDPGSGFTIHFVEARVSGTPVLHEHQAVRWCTLPGLLGLELAPSDHRFVRRLRAERITREAASAALAAWGMTELSPAPRVEFSPRLRSSLGRCYPSRGLIRLRADLVEEEQEGLLREVLYHELAHLVVHAAHGRKARPHGPEWRGLMQAVGCPPRVSVCNGAEPVRPGAAAANSYAHHCPVCGSVRWAKRPVPHWRCTHCAETGLPGALLISSSPARAR